MDDKRSTSCPRCIKIFQKPLYGTKNQWIRAKTRVPVVDDIQKCVLCAHCVHSSLHGDRGGALTLSMGFGGCKISTNGYVGKWGNPAWVSKIELPKPHFLEHFDCLKTVKTACRRPFGPSLISMGASELVTMHDELVCRAHCMAFKTTLGIKVR